MMGTALVQIKSAAQRALGAGRKARAFSTAVVWRARHARRLAVPRGGVTGGVCAVVNTQALGDLTISFPALRLLSSALHRDNWSLYVVSRPEYTDWVASRVPHVHPVGCSMRGRSSHQVPVNVRFDVVCDWNLTEATAACELFRTAGAVNCAMLVPTGFQKSKRTATHLDLGGLSPDSQYRQMYLHMAAESCRWLRVPCDAGMVVDPEQSLRETSGSEYIVVQPGTSRAGLTRRWPVEHFTELAERIKRATGISAATYVLGPDEGAEIRQYIEAKGDRIVQPASVMELAKIIRNASLFIGNSSGPLHMAAECGVRTMYIVGPSSPKWGPHGEKHLEVRLPLPCTGCENTTRCTIKLACIRDLTVDFAERQFTAWWGRGGRLR